MRLLGLAVVTLLVGRAAAETPAKRARQLFDQQLAALKEPAHSAIDQHFDAKALVGGGDVYMTLVGGSPHIAIKKVKVTAFTGGGSDTAVWMSADLAITSFGSEPEMGPPTTSTAPVRITELIVSDGTTWKVVAASISELHRAEIHTEAPTMEGSTPAGTLAALPAAMPALKAALSTDPGVIVVGTDKGERAVGAKAAAKLLDRWSTLKLELAPSVREVHTAAWSYLQGTVDLIKGKDHYRMSVLVIALPAADGTWKVGAIHYAAAI